MLSQLYIENIAVIERISLEFTDGFTVLTGETGAGKSILIDAINAVLGMRISKDLIRAGAPSAKIVALFQALSPDTLQKLEALGVETDEEGSILLQRTLSTDGKSVCRINGQPATVSLLKEIGILLLNIHGQHDNQRLLSPETHVQYLDSFGKLSPLVKAYEEAYFEYRTHRKELKRMTLDESERIRKMDLLRYQIEEIEGAGLTSEEQETLSARKKQILNAETMVSALTEARLSLNGEEEFPGGVENVERTAAALSGIVSYLPDGDELLERLEGIAYELRDCAVTLDGALEEMEYSPEELAEIEERLDVIYRLSLKYGSTTREILTFLNEAKSELTELENIEDNRAVLEEKCSKEEELVVSRGEALSDARRKAAKLFTARIQEELSFLDMEKVTLRVEQNPSTYTAAGADQIQFLISTNPGEPPKPLAKIASGGELSRIMLALKNVLAQLDGPHTLIFDEIDAGISGHAAQQVGLKIAQVSRGQQVICVTHLAQIACQADTHVLIEKRVEKERTFTSLAVLCYEQRLRELARIMGNPESKAMLESAGELLQSAGIEKQG